MILVEYLYCIKLERKFSLMLCIDGFAASGVADSKQGPDTKHWIMAGILMLFIVAWNCWPYQVYSRYYVFQFFGKVWFLLSVPGRCWACLLTVKLKLND